MKITLVKPQLSSDYQYIQQSHLLYTQHVGKYALNESHNLMSCYFLTMLRNGQIVS